MADPGGIRRLCVYCGSSPGNDPAYREGAVILAQALADRGIELVYGGSSKGVMGVLADAALARGGRVIGVMPHSLVRKEIAHDGLSELHVTETMHERKSMMADLADGFIALPGGFGTLEEIIEVLTWGQLGFHKKPCGMLNVAGYFDRLFDFMSHAERAGFLRSEHRGMLLHAPDAEALLDAFDEYRAPDVAKWRD